MFVRLLRLFRELGPNRHFAVLWASQLLSLTAFNMVNFTLLIRVFELTGSTTFVSLFVLSFGLPSLLFGAVAGVFADRWNHRSVLITTNALRTLVVLLYLPALAHLPTIYAVTFVIATVTQFFTPAEGALIPELVEPKRLVAANAVFTMTLFISFVLGYGLAGPLAATGGDSLPIIVATAMFGLATLACLALPKLPETHRRVAIRAAYRSVGGQLREGFRAVRANAPVRYGLAHLTVIWATIGVVMVLLPAFTGEVLGLNLREVSRLIILPIGVGMVAGGYVLHRSRHQFSIRSIITASLVLAGISIITMGQIGPLSGVLSSAFSWDQGALREVLTSSFSTLLGVGVAAVMIASQTLIHERTPREMRGRVFGFLGTSVNAANTVPVFAAGALTDVFRVATVVTLLGGLLLVWAVASRRLGKIP